MLESIIDTSRCGAPKSRWPRRVGWKLQRARGAIIPLPHLALHPYTVCAGAHVTPMAPQAGATALKLVASRLVEACRGRPTAHEGVATATTFLFYPRFQSVVVCLVGRRLVRQPRALLCFLSLSLYLSLSLFLLPPHPHHPRPAVYRAFFIFFPSHWFSLSFLRTAGIHGGGRPRHARPCADRGGALPLARSYVTARRLAPRPVCALNTDGVNCGRGGSHLIATAGCERKKGRRCNAARGRTCWLCAAVAPAREDVKVREGSTNADRATFTPSPLSFPIAMYFERRKGVVYEVSGNLQIVLNFNRQC